MSAGHNHLIATAISNLLMPLADLLKPGFEYSENVVYARVAHDGNLVVFRVAEPRQTIHKETQEVA
jgi:hypothetical protein